MRLIKKLTVIILLIGLCGSANAAVNNVVNDNELFSCTVYNDKGDGKTTKTDDEEEPDCD